MFNKGFFKVILDFDSVMRVSNFFNLIRLKYFPILNLNAFQSC